MAATQTKTSKATTVKRIPITTVREPTIAFSTLRIPQPGGGVLLKPGPAKEVPDLISTLEASRILGISDRRVQYLCQHGSFKTACKPGGTERSNWRLGRQEVLSRLEHRWDEGPARYSRVAE